MSFKSQVESIASDLNGQVEHLPERATRARKMVNDMTQDLAERTVETVRRYPGRSILGAFAVGFLIAKVAKHV